MSVVDACCNSKSWARVQSPQASVCVLGGGASIRTRGSTPPACGLWPSARHAYAMSSHGYRPVTGLDTAAAAVSPLEAASSKFGPPAPLEDCGERLISDLCRGGWSIVLRPRVGWGPSRAEVCPLSADLHRIPGQPRPRPFPAEGFPGRPKPPPGPCWCVARESYGIIRTFVLVWLVSPLMRSP